MTEPARSVVTPVAIVRREQRAPTADRAVLVAPAASAVPALVAANVQWRSTAEYDFQSTSLAALSAQARQELRAAALAYTAQYRDPPALPAGDRIFFAGHQPLLFHAGVWIKNFALSAWAQHEQATAINLIVDNDTLKAPTIRVPSGSLAQPQQTLIPFDAQTTEIPIEQRTIHDRTTFESFGARASDVLRPFVSEPLLTEYWPRAIARGRATNRLGLALAQARHQLEGELGLSTLELPLSQVCGTAAFAQFAAHLLAHAGRWRTIYNAVVHEYRRVYRLRSANHPVPDLAADDSSIEVPFWLWTNDDPRRRRAFVARSSAGWQLTDRQSLAIPLPLNTTGSLEAAAATLAGLRSQGIQFRTRAPTTTLFARLVAGDLFIHGIGGGKYDELTDAIAARFFGLRLPGYVVLSGTLQLPVARPMVTPQDLRDLDRQLRDLSFNAERYFTAEARAATQNLLAEKARWIATTGPVEPSHARSRALRAINEQLQPWVVDQRAELLARREQARQSLSARQVLAWREYPYCLMPRTTLENFLLENRALQI